MSAPQIPNLLSLRGRGGTRIRGGSRGVHSSPASALSHDTTIQGTDTDASVSRLSAVDLGYLEDPFARYFVQNAGVGPPTRRLPIINRGTYTRTTTLDRLITAFLSVHSGAEGEKRQIVSLGAGTDTRCFRLLSRPETTGLVYHEIDFPDIAARKLQTVQSLPALRNIITNPEAAGSSWSSRSLPNGSEYWCHGLDLRSLLQPEMPLLNGLRRDIPTLLVSECCLCYLEPAQAKGVIKYFADAIPNLSLIVYEPIQPDDPFGRQMVANLAARRIRMPTLELYKTTSDQEVRLKEAGFDVVTGMTVEDIWKTWISPEEKERVDELEGLDEVEEWNLLAGHYSVVWGWRGRGFEGWKDI